MAAIVSISPPSIHHLPERPKKYRQMVIDAAANIHLRQQATKLLSFYAKRTEGFTPALALIERETGISKNKVSEIRARLVQHGLIHFDKQRRRIYIAWDRIRAFAMLDKPLLLSRGQYTFFSFSPEQYTTKRIKYSHSKQHRILSVPFTEEQRRQICLLERMSAEEFNLILSII